jgi:hypothetical protein
MPNKPREGQASIISQVRPQRTCLPLKGNVGGQRRATGQNLG